MKISGKTFIASANECSYLDDVIELLMTHKCECLVYFLQGHSLRHSCYILIKTTGDIKTRYVMYN